MKKKSNNTNTRKGQIKTTVRYITSLKFKLSPSKRRNRTVLEKIYTVGKNVKCYWGEQSTSSAKLKLELPQDPIILLLEMYLKEMNLLGQRDTWSTYTTICLLSSLTSPIPPLYLASPFFGVVSSKYR